jgi:anti-sigma-K factor RskA
MLTSDKTVRMTVVSTQAKPQPQGRVFYQREKGHLMFFASNFPSLPTKKVYELWLVPMAGAPIPAGTFVPDAKGAGSVMLPAMPANVEAKTFAITIENEGGSETPTMPIIMAAQ